MNALLPAIQAAGRRNFELRPERRNLSAVTLPTNRVTTLQAAASSKVAVSQPSVQALLTPHAKRHGSWMMPQLGAITPEYIENVLRGALMGSHVQEWELFNLMQDTDPEIAACCQEFVEGVQRKKLIFEPFREEDEEPTPSALERMKLCSKALRSMRPDPCADENDLDGTIKDILDAWFKAAVVLEVAWSDANGELNRINAGALGEIVAPRATFWVHPVCYAWSNEGRLGLRAELNALRNVTRATEAERYGGYGPGYSNIFQNTALGPRPGSVDEFPAHKFLIGLHKAKSGSALGGAVLRPLAWWWCASNFCGDWLLNLAQLFGIPFRKAKYSTSTSDSTLASIRTMLRDCGSAGYIMLPDTADVEFIEAGTTAGQSPQAFLFEFADRQKRKIILGQTMSANGATTGAGNGAGAFGRVEADVKSDRIDAGGKFACSVLNAQLIPSILELNYGDSDEAPTVRLLEEEEGTLEDAQRDGALATAGLKIGVNFLRKKYGIPEPAKDEETIGGVPEPEPTREGERPRESQTNLEARASGPSRKPSTLQLASATARDIEPLLAVTEALAASTSEETKRELLGLLVQRRPEIEAALRKKSNLAKLIATP